MSGVTLEHDWFEQPLPANVRVGPRSWLYSSFAFRHYRSRLPLGVSIGHDTGVYNGTFFDLGPEGCVEVGDFTTLVGAIICTNTRVSLGSYVFIAHEVVLADDPAGVPHDSPRTAPTATPRGITIADNVWIGAQAVILGGAHIGEGSIIGAASVVDFEVPAFSLVAGNPGRIVRSLR